MEAYQLVSLLGDAGTLTDIRRIADALEALVSQGQKAERDEAIGRAEMAERFLKMHVCCPECESLDVKEITYLNDFGSMACRDCGYAGDPGEDFPTILRARQERERLQVLVAELEGKR